MIVAANHIPVYWSNRRRSLWHSCRLRYFFHCFGSWGGFDPDAPAESRELHRLKRLMNKEEYLTSLLVRCIREHFYQSPDETLEKIVQIRFRRDWFAMQNFSAEDHNLPRLRELEFEPCRWRELQQELQMELSGRIALLKDGFYGTLEKIPLVDRLELPYPLAVTLGDLTCYTPVVLCWSRGNELIFADLSDTPESALFHRYCAMEKTGLPPEGVVSFHLDLQSGLFRRFDNALPVSGLLRGIRQDIREMSAAIRMDGSADSGDFPAAAGEHCRKCPYRSFCC